MDQKVASMDTIYLINSHCNSQYYLGRGRGSFGRERENYRSKNLIGGHSVSLIPDNM